MNECARELEWAGGRHVFCLNHPAVLDVLAGSSLAKKARTKAALVPLLKLEGQYGDTPAACLRRFEESVYSFADVERVMLYGLWGGGMSFPAAYELIEQHVVGQPIHRNAVVAYEVIAGLFIGAAANASAA